MAIIAITTSNSINVNARLIKNRVFRSKDQAVLRIRRSERLLFKIPAYGELLNLKNAAPGSMATVTGLVLPPGTSVHTTGLERLPAFWRNIPVAVHERVSWLPALVKDKSTGLAAARWRATISST